MAKNTVLWDQPIFKATLSTDTAAEILAVTASGTLVKRPAINTSSFMSSALVSAHLFVGNGSNIATDVAVTGDVTISNAGVTAIGAGVIVNADINALAAIAVSKLAALTATRVAVLDASGFLAASSVTPTTLAFLDVTSSAQTQLNGKLTATITTPALGDILRYNGATWVNLAIGTTDQFLKVVAGEPAWATLTPPSIPTGGTAGQYLNKINGTDFNTQWSTLTLVKVTDVTASVAEVNLLDGVTATTAELNYIDGVTSPVQDQLDDKQDIITGGASTIVSANLAASMALISTAGGKVAVSAVPAVTLAFLDATSSVQTQLNTKLSTSLTENYMIVGGGSNTAISLAPGTSGYVLTSVGGVPTWAANSGGITNGAAANELMKSNGTNAVASGVFSTTAGDLTLGTGLTGATRTFTATGSASDVGATFLVKGAGAINFGDTASTGNNALLFYQKAISSARYSNTAGDSVLLSLYRSRGTTGAAPSAVTNGDSIGSISFVSNATSDVYGAEIRAVVNGAVSAGVAPTDLIFLTGTGASPTERLRINSAGDITIAHAAGKVGFFATAAVVKQAGLTAITHTAPGTPDYAIQDLTNVGGFGFVTKDEGNTVLSVIKAMHDAMKAYGLLT